MGEIDTTNNFSFDLINPECISKIINNLDSSKATQQGDIPTKVIKDNKDIFHILFLQALTMLSIRHQEMKKKIIDLCVFTKFIKNL